MRQVMSGFEQTNGRHTGAGLPTHTKPEAHHTENTPAAVSDMRLKTITTTYALTQALSKKSTQAMCFDE